LKDGDKGREGGNRNLPFKTPMRVRIRPLENSSTERRWKALIEEILLKRPVKGREER